MSSAFQTDSGTLWAHAGVAELGRETPAIACLIAAASPAKFSGRNRETELVTSIVISGKFEAKISRFAIFLCALHGECHSSTRESRHISC